MNGLSVATVILIYVFGAVLSGTALFLISLLFTVLTGLRIRPVAFAVWFVVWLESVFQDIVNGFTNGVEWLVYGSRYSA